MVFGKRDEPHDASIRVDRPLEGVHSHNVSGLRVPGTVLSPVCDAHGSPAVVEGAIVFEDSHGF
jgi:hypothetical protein